MKKALILSLLVNILFVAGLVLILRSYLDLQSQVRALEEAQMDESAIAYYLPSAAFTDAEKERLQEMVLDPYYAYEACLGESPVIAAEIEESDTAGYLYVFTLFAKDGSYHSFLYGEPGVALPYYTPDLLLTRCVDVLPHADEIRDQAVEEYRG